MRITPFVLIGSVVAWVGEFVFNILITGNYSNFLFTLLFYPCYLALAFYLQKYLACAFKIKHIHFFACYFLFGFIGLAIEWFVIGNSPWGNPEAIQFGQFSYWTALVLVPLIVLGNVSKRAKYLVLYILAKFVILSLIFFFVLPPHTHLFFLTILLTIAYVLLHIPYVMHWKALKKV